MENETTRLKAVAGALERIFGTEVLESDREDFWTMKAAELIEEIEAEGILIE